MNALGGPDSKVIKAELVAEALRHEIAIGLRVAGSQLPPEVELMRRYAISRPTCREALRLLESEGLIRIGRGPSGGARVTVPTVQWISRHVGILLQLRSAPLKDLYAARLAYEPLAARAIAERRDQAALKDLAQCAAAQEFTVDDRVAFNMHEASFRSLLLQHSGNEVLGLMGAVLDDVLRRHMAHDIHRFILTEEAVEHRAAAAKGKQRLVRLMAEGDAEGAVKIWTQYIETYWVRIAAKVGDQAAIEVYHAGAAPLSMTDCQASSSAA